ncbi:hypothetical protein, partial [Pseudomonas sp. PS01298]|uniref:hypothetical protein n=1 Tax=Pseudomonas sp. PS01298 TaxID=2991434 RepID=UPI00249ADA5B
VGLRSSPIKQNAVFQLSRGACFGAAAQPNAGQARSPQGRSPQGLLLQGRSQQVHLPLGRYQRFMQR